MTKRKDKKYPKEDYDKVTEAYKKIKGAQPKGSEWKPIQQAIKTMFMNDRTPEQIIGLMKWLEQSNEKWTQNWTIRTVKIKMPEFVAGKFKLQSKEEAIKEVYPEIDKYPTPNN